MKFTLARIDALKCPEGKRDMLAFDDEQRGLAVRVTASGGKELPRTIFVSWDKEACVARIVRRRLSAKAREATSGLPPEK